MNTTIRTACTPAQAWAEQPLNVPVLWAGARFEEMDSVLQQAHDGIRDDASEQRFSEALGLIDAHCDVRPHAEVLGPLAAWAQRLPASAMPWLLRARHWTDQAFAVRGTGWAGSVGADQWALSAVLRDAALLAACQALARDPGQYRAFSSIIRAVAGFGEPGWLVRWLDEGVAPSAADLEIPGELREALSARGLTAQEFAIGVPPGWPEAVRQVLPRRGALLEAHGPQRFWAEVALASHPWALHAVDTCLWFATERWGGSDEAIKAFIDSPLCDRFDESAKNELRFGMQFQDKVAGDSHDPDNRRHDLALCKRMLGKPLPEWALAAVQLRLARVHAAEAEALEEGSAERIPLLARAGEGMVQAAPKVADQYDLVFAIEFWLLHARDKDWIATIAERRRLHHPYAAMLYGLLLEHGWAGVPHRPDLCDAWYDLAAAGMAPTSGEEDDPYKVFYIPLCMTLGDNVSPLRLIEHGAARGYPSPQFRLAYIHEQRWRDGEAASEEPMRRFYTAAAERDYWPALFNLVNYHNGLSNADGADARTQAKHRLKAVAYAVRLLDLYDQEGEVPAAYEDFQARMLRYFKSLMEWHVTRFEEVTQAILPQLRAKAEAGQLDAMCAMALLHGDKRDKRHHHFREAVRWITGAKKLDAEDASVLETEDLLEGKSLWRIFRFLVVAGRIPAHELPGQGDQQAL